MSCHTGQLHFFTQEATPLVSPTTIPVYRVSLVRESMVQYPDTRLSSSTTAAEIFRRYLADVDREHFLVVFLNRKNEIIGLHTVSIGSLTASVVHPREVFKAAILANCSALVAGHNHPSGNPQPSQEDRVLTTRLAEAGRLLGIQLLDHIIIGDERRYFSFADEGLL